jgi:hypothetical protein
MKNSQLCQPLILKLLPNSGHAFRYDRITVLIGRRAAAQQPQGFVAGVPKLVFAAGRDGDGVAGFYIARFAFDANPSLAVRDVIYFLGLDVIMFLRARAGRQTRFRQALVADDGIAMRQQFTDFGTVLGNKRCKVVEILDIHGILDFGLLRVSD